METVKLTSTRDTGESLPVNTIVTFACDAKSNPPAELSLLSRDMGITNQIGFPHIGTSLVMSVRLKEEDSEAEFYCQAKSEYFNQVAESSERYLFLVSSTGNRSILSCIFTSSIYLSY